MENESENIIDITFKVIQCLDDLSINQRKECSNNVKYIKELIDISKRDLSIANWCYSRKYYANCVYHLQQAIEKIAKALGLYVGAITKNELKSISHTSPKVVLKILQMPQIECIFEQLSKDQYEKAMKILDNLTKRKNKKEKIKIARYTQQKIKVLLKGINKYKEALCNLFRGHNKILKINIRGVINFAIMVGSLSILTIITFPHEEFTRYPSNNRLSPKDYKEDIGIVVESKEIIKTLKSIIKVMNNELKECTKAKYNKN